MAAPRRNTYDKRQADQSHVTETKIGNNMDITSDVDQICADNPVHENTDKMQQADQSHVTETKIGDNNMDITSDVDQICADNPVHEVIQTPNNMEALPGVGVLVQCLKKVRASPWTLEEKPFFVENMNISRSLEYPSLTAAGSRLYYQFKLNIKELSVLF
ncbi:hypothetical protein MAR_038552 [Mya arenaria]|uniref:Uncharacterized protein n=1 Tax=Mya arenaria TaxID=6604 RepID=A0ABY7FRN1_MYAAR|nr:hypothetical protein MAR_038552 [Mya arenaria]